MRLMYNRQELEKKKEELERHKWILTLSYNENRARQLECEKDPFLRVAHTTAKSAVEILNQQISTLAVQIEEITLQLQQTLIETQPTSMGP